MALDINLTDGGGERDMVTVDRHWYLTEDGSRVVEENDPACRWLWASPGTEVPRREAERLGAVKPVQGPSAVPSMDSTVEETVVKEAARPADKQRAKPGDKSATVDELRHRAADLGVQVDNRWGAERLRTEIANAESDA